MVLDRDVQIHKLRTGADLATIQAAQTRLATLEWVIRLVRQDQKFALTGDTR